MIFPKRTRTRAAIFTAALTACTFTIGWSISLAHAQDPAPASNAPATQPSADQQPAVTPAPTEPTTQPSTEPAAAPTADANATSQPASQPAAAVAAPPPPSLFPDEPPVSAEEKIAREVFADSMAQIAKNSLAMREIRPEVLRQNAVLLAIAARANPNDPRILRLLAEAKLAVNDTNAVEQALKRYVDVLNANAQVDQVAMAQLIDIYARGRESADDKVKYLKGVTEAAQLAAEVRAHAAVRLAQVYLDRAQDTDAQAMIDDAIKLNPVNPMAQRMRFEQRGASASPSDRVMMLAGILRASPLQPEVMALLAHELADVGLSDPAITWYRQSFDLSGRMGRGLNLPDFLECACTLLVAGQPRDAIDYANKILSSDPGNADAAFIKLLAQKRMGGEPEIAAAKQQASDAALRRMQDLHAQLENAPSAPATQPADAVADQMLVDVPKLKDQNAPIDPAVRGAYVSGLARVAFFELYFNENPAAANKFIDALRGLLPEGDTNVVRLEGWSFLAQGKNDEARVKLSAVADRDPIAKLGMIRMAGKEAGAPANAPPGSSAGTTELTKLIGDNASGVTGAILAEALRDHGVRVVPPGPNAPAVRRELDAFPRGFLSFLDRPDQFYRMICEPLKVRHMFGEPMLVKVSIVNLSDFDLSLGPDGAIRPDLWFDVTITGMGAESMGGVTYDRMGQRLVLPKRGGTCAQIVRMDDGRVGQLLASNPVMSIPLMFNVITNPVPSQSGVAPGPGGYRTQFNRVMERAAAPIMQPQFQQQLVAPLFNGNAGEQMHASDILSRYIMMLRSDDKIPPEVKSIADTFYDQLERAANVGSGAGAGGQNTASPTARAWIQFQLAQIAPEARRERIIDELINGDVWTERVLGIAMLNGQPPAAIKPRLAKIVEADTDPTVRALAKSMLETADLPVPSTQPAQAEPGTTPPAPDGSNPFPAATPDPTTTTPPTQSPK